MTSLCLSFVTLLVVINRILGADYDSFRSDLNSEGRPILRGGFEDLLDNINLDINVRVEPKKLKNHEDSRQVSEDPRQSHEINEDPPKIVEAQPHNEAVVSMLRKRPKSSEEINSDIDEKLPDLRTAAPDNSASNETQEALAYLRIDHKEDKSPEDKVVRLISEEDKSPEEKTVRLLKEDDESREQTKNTFVSEENTSGVAKLRMGSSGNSEWMKDLRSYVKILASKYQKDGILAHMKPVIKVLERTHKIKIKDIDGKVKIDYRSKE